ncbi:LOW QUALITY PROTEIN: uncharacterized protein [Temnothorax nylanderi]|uniref:LOW QUALITY PROTEIN: uncharacterized protein n=1 Tax=Temnothorax nylanderi TaxID=102681 RepID=UPI003A88F6BE
MKMKFFVIIFVVFAVGAQCRSVTLSNVRDTGRICMFHVRVIYWKLNIHAQRLLLKRIKNTVCVDSLNLAGEKISINTPEQLKELIALYEENFGKLINFAIKMSKNKDNNKREIQFLNQLSSLIEQLVKEQSKVRNVHAKFDNDTNAILQASSDNPMKNVNNNVNNVEDLINTMKEIDIVYQDGEITDEHIRIKRAAEGYKRAASFATEERMTSMLIDIQRQVVQIRKYLDKLCKKHHPTSTAILEVNSDDDTSSIDQPK